MGNIELHLILGQPHVPSGDDLIVGHIAFESDDIGVVLTRLKEMDIKYETNVSVPKGGKKKGIVTQYFLRDPDGYYLELCNCSVLTDFCFGKDEESRPDITEYIESAKKGGKSRFFQQMAQMGFLAYKAQHQLTIEDAAEILKKFAVDHKSVKVNEVKLNNMVKRLKVYGDSVQGETKEGLMSILRRTNNNVPDAMSYIKAKHGDHQIFQPPTIIVEGKHVKPPSFHIKDDE